MRDSVNATRFAQHAASFLLTILPRQPFRKPFHSLIILKVLRSTLLLDLLLFHFLFSILFLISFSFSIFSFHFQDKSDGNRWKYGVASAYHFGDSLSAFDIILRLRNSRCLPFVLISDHWRRRKILNHLKVQNVDWLVRALLLFYLF